jgi:ferritin-like metal-binding protein YciE
MARFGLSLFSMEDDVGLFSKDIKTMNDLLLHGLQDIYYAEQQITKALPKMIDRTELILLDEQEPEMIERHRDEEVRKTGI